MDTLEYTILIPCLNEERTIAGCVAQAVDVIRHLGQNAEVLVVDNGSDDTSPLLACTAGARVIVEEKRGYGNALKTGIFAARGRYIIMGDADGSYDFWESEHFLKRLRDGNALVLGNRFSGRIEPGAMKFLHQYLGNPLFSNLVRICFGKVCGDVYCGLRGFSTRDILALELSSEGMEFALEMVVRAKNNGLKITEIPITLYPTPSARTPHLKTWSDGLKGMKLLFKIHILNGFSVLRMQGWLHRFINRGEC